MCSYPTLLPLPRLSASQRNAQDGIAPKHEGYIRFYREMDGESRPKKSQRRFKVSGAPTPSPTND